MGVGEGVLTTYDDNVLCETSSNSGLHGGNEDSLSSVWSKRSRGACRDDRIHRIRE